MASKEPTINYTISQIQSSAYATGIKRMQVGTASRGGKHSSLWPAWGWACLQLGQHAGAGAASRTGCRRLSLLPSACQVVHGHYEGQYGDCQKCQLGLSLAHLQIWRRMIAERIPRAWVFEDDVVFHQDFSTLFPVYWRQVPEDALVVWVGHSRIDYDFYCRCGCRCRPGWRARLAGQAGG
jgi:hypothetical protein